MFSFFAALFSIAWIMEHWLIVVGVIVVVIALIVFFIHRKKKRLAAYYALPVVFVGNKATRVYHYPSCAKVSNLARANAVYFRSAAEVDRAGYKPCSICNP